MFKRQGLMVICLIIVCILLFSCTSAEQTSGKSGQADLLDYCEPRIQELCSGDELPISLTYRYLGEASEEYTVTDSQTIAAILDAILNITVCNETDIAATDSDDIYIFTTASSETFSFSFNMHHLCVGDKKYELENNQDLWNLTAKIQQGESE